MAVWGGVSQVKDEGCCDLPTSPAEFWKPGQDSSLQSPPLVLLVQVSQACLKEEIEPLR